MVRKLATRKHVVDVIERYLEEQASVSLNEIAFRTGKTTREIRFIANKEGYDLSSAYVRGANTKVVSIARK